MDQSIEPVLVERMAINFREAVMSNDMDTMCDIARSLGMSPEEAATTIVMARQHFGITPENDHCRKSRLRIVK